MSLDLMIRGGTVVTAEKTFRADVGIRGEKIAEIGPSLSASKVIEASGKLVMPGGVDSHCHVEQLSSTGKMCADDFYSATVAAAFGGTTTIVPFAAQHRGNSIVAVVDDYAKRAAEKAVIDYGFHLIIADPTPKALDEELPQMVRRGITSFKVYMTYDLLRLSDEQMLDVLAAAERERALVMVHAENHEMIKWITKRLLERGHGAPKFHMAAHHPIAEAEATNRVVALSRLLDVPVLIVHVSGGEAVQTIRAAQTLGARVLAETCPQYLFLKASDADKAGLEGAKWCCSPPPRDEASQEAVWAGLKDGTFQVLSSDHAPYRFDETGKLPKGDKTTFKEMANGVPGLQVRLPLLFSEGVGKGRLSLNEFVALTSTNHARTYGIAEKGRLEPGADADVAIWEPEKRVSLTAALMKDNVGYTPYEGMTVTGWPTTVLSRGRVAVHEGRLLVERGSGKFIARGVPAPVASAKLREGPASILRKLIG
ncbi:MAG: dihydropyrimidinase [Betaproteobacteria bacterium RIFCSPLOWO2_12_FULL_65_14]|nr:MAG: dihydropyrimidinase [Betaproteobacteria bacterium RIFCSPLOWO2_12_FULL_65_14]